jgi:hypothetical protein
MALKWAQQGMQCLKAPMKLLKVPEN